MGSHRFNGPLVFFFILGLILNAGETPSQSSLTWEARYGPQHVSTSPAPCTFHWALLWFTGGQRW